MSHILRKYCMLDPPLAPFPTTFSGASGRPCWSEMSALSWLQRPAKANFCPFTGTDRGCPRRERIENLSPVYARTGDAQSISALSHPVSTPKQLRAPEKLRSEASCASTPSCSPARTAAASNDVAERLGGEGWEVGRQCRKAKVVNRAEVVVAGQGFNAKKLAGRATDLLQ